MHEMNPYKRAKPDFSKLSDKYPALKKCMRSDDSGAQIVDWSNPLSSRLLSQALMAEDFALDVEFEADRLCPPLPNRINYLCWLAEIFQSCGIAPEVAVMDVGVGASCVYPLLGHKMFGWRFIGSDIDPDSILKASRNISKNNLQHFITTVLVPNSEGIQRYLLETGQSSISDPLKTANTFLSDDPIDSTLTTTNDADDCEGFVPDGKRPPDRSTTAVRALFASGAAYTAEHRGPLRQAIAAMGGESLAALLQLERQWADSVGKIDAAVPESVEVWLTGCMTNPPFYSFDEDIAIRPSCTGRNTELCTLGGEVCFLLAIYADSKILRHRVTWYSCMTGKKSTARLLLKHLNSEGIENVRSTRFFQGSTTRWGIAWSYTTAGLNLISDKDKVFSKSLKRPKRDGCIPSSLGSASSSASSAKVTEKEFLSTMLQAEKTVCSIAESCAPDAFLEMATVRAFHSLVQAYLGNTTDGPVPLNSADKSAASHSRAGVYPPFRLLSATFIAVSCGRCQDVISTATLSDSDAPSSLSVSCSRCGLDKQALFLLPVRFLCPSKVIFYCLPVG